MLSISLRPEDSAFVDVEKAKKDLDAFVDANEPRLYKLLKSCGDPQTDLSTLVKARVSAIYRCKEPG
jgi:sister-chromatid-cohesion protein PDS5